MDPEEKKPVRYDSQSEADRKNHDYFGKVIDALHTKQKLPSLRTYQGDMAEFIRSKNQSTISIAIKEKERKERIEQEENLAPVQKISAQPGNFKTNFVALFLSLLLLSGGAVALMYVTDFFKKESVVPVVTEVEIIPYNNLITLANVSKQNFGSELSKINPSSGINIIKISGDNGQIIKKVKDFFQFVKITIPSGLERVLKDNYALGIISKDYSQSNFLIISVSDFGRAFSGMLAWEEKMDESFSFWDLDLAVSNTTATISASTSTLVSTSANTNFSNPKNTVATGTTKIIATKINKNISTSSASTTILVKIPMKPEAFSWKDIIVKNKDTRALVDSRDQAQIAYAFLDKNTIIITDSLWAIGEISTVYTSRAVVR